MLAQESLKALGGLGLLSLGGKYILRRVFEVCIIYIFSFLCQKKKRKKKEGIQTHINIF